MFLSLYKGFAPSHNVHLFGSVASQSRIPKSRRTIDDAVKCTSSTGATVSGGPLDFHSLVLQLYWNDRFPRPAGSSSSGSTTLVLERPSPAAGWIFLPCNGDPAAGWMFLF